MRQTPRLSTLRASTPGVTHTPISLLTAVVLGTLAPCLHHPSTTLCPYFSAPPELFGIDVMFGARGQPFLLEANLDPSLSIEELSGTPSGSNAQLKAKLLVDLFNLVGVHVPPTRAPPPQASPAHAPPPRMPPAETAADLAGSHPAGGHARTARPSRRTPADPRPRSRPFMPNVKIILKVS